MPLHSTLVSFAIGRPPSLRSRQWIGRNTFGANGLVMAAMPHARHDQSGVLLLTHARELFEKGDRRPKFVVAVVGPGGHPRHFDAILQDPKHLGRAESRSRISKVRRLWIETRRNIAF